MNSFLIQSYKGGISDYEDKGVPGSFKFGSGLNIRTKKDSLKAQQGLADDLAIGGVINSPVVQIVNSTDGNTYIALENGRIIQRNSSGTYTLKYTDVEGDLRGFGEWGNDEGNMGFYWATPTKLHRMEIDGNWSSDIDATVASQSYPKENLTNTPNHLMATVNGAFLINNGDAMAMVGYDESYTNNALQLLPGNLSQVILDDGQYAKIGANRNDSSEQSWMYVWDMVSQNYNDREPIPVADINAIIKTEITLMQVGSEGLIYFFGDATKLPILSLPGGGQVKQAGVENDNGLALLGVYGNDESRQTGVYSYGRIKKNASFVLNLDYPLDVDYIHAVKKVGDDILIFYQDGSNYGVKKVDTSNKISQAIYESLVLKYPPSLDKRPITHLIQIVCAPLPEGCSIEIWRRNDQIESGGTDYLSEDTGENDGWFQCSMQDGGGSLNTEGATQGVFNVGDSVRFLEIKAVLNCNANNSPEIFKIQPFFE